MSAPSNDSNSSPSSQHDRPAAAALPPPDDDGRSEMWKVWGGAALIVALGLLLAYQFVGAPPPDRLVLATGVEGGGYDTGGKLIRDEMALSGIEVELRRTAGTLENLELLRTGAANVAFVQGGVGTDEELEGLTGVASLYYEPLWIFVGKDSGATTLKDLGGRRVQVGAPGSGTRAVATELLEARGVAAELQTDSPDDAMQSLIEGRSDAMFLVGTPSSPRVARMYAEESVKPLSLRLSTAFSRHFKYLQDLTLTPGMIDLEKGLPAAGVALVAPAACLLARDDLHPSMFPLLIEAAREKYRVGGLFEDEGEFPSPLHLDVPAAKPAMTYFRDGPSFLYRLLPFQIAASLDRLKVMLLPLLTLLLPLFRIAPPAYRWRIRRKIIRWYKVVLDLEAAVRRSPTREAMEAAVEELGRLRDEIATVRVPLGYAEELYNLRMHLKLVRQEYEQKRSELDARERPADPELAGAH